MSNMFRKAMRFATGSLAALAVLGVTAVPATAGSAKSKLPKYNIEELNKRIVDSANKDPLPPGSTMTGRLLTPGDTASLFEVVLHPAGAPKNAIPVTHYVRCGLYRAQNGTLVHDPDFDSILENPVVVQGGMAFKNVNGTPLLYATQDNMKAGLVFGVFGDTVVRGGCDDINTDDFSTCTTPVVLTGDETASFLVLIKREAGILNRICGKCAEAVQADKNSPSLNIISGQEEPSRVKARQIYKAAEEYLKTALPH